MVRTVYDEVGRFLRGNRRPSLGDIEKFARGLDRDPAIFISQVFELLGSFLGEGDYLKLCKGLDDDDGRFEVSPQELEVGTEIEFEHTSDGQMAHRIALDHLAEIPDYYTRLAAMEREAREAGSVTQTEARSTDLASTIRKLREQRTLKPGKFAGKKPCSRG